MRKKGSHSVKIQSVYIQKNILEYMTQWETQIQKTPKGRDKTLWFNSPMEMQKDKPKTAKGSHCMFHKQP